MTLPEITQVILSVITIIGAIGGSLLTTYAWVKTKFAEHDLKIANIEAHFKAKDEAQLRESSILSRELMEMRQEASRNHSRLEELVTNIRLNCVSHNEIIKNMNGMIELAVKREFEKSHE